MAKLLTTLLVLVLLAVPARAQDLDARTPLSIELNLDSRATYEAIAERAGLNVVFVRNYTPKPAEPFRAENKTPAEALDQLAKQTVSFWTPWDGRTILVAEDTQQNRRDFDRQFVQVLPVAGRSPVEVLNELRAGGFRQVMAVGNALLVRDNAAQIRVAARAANPDAAAPTFDLNGIFVAENHQSWRTPEARRAELKIKTAGSLSVNVDESFRTTYERLANNAGVNILFGRGFQTTSARFAVREVGFFDALDLLALTTNTFWQPLNQNTILVMEDTQQNRRDFEIHTAETIYLPPDTAIARLNEIMNGLRTVLSLRGIYQAASARAVVIHDTPARILLAESAIADISGVPIRKRLATDSRTMFPETGTSFYTAASDRDRLEIKTKEPIAFRSTASLREAFDKLAAVAGLQVLFGRNFPARTVDFNIQNVDVIEALDFLALQSQTFWQPLDARTILVVEDTQQNHRNYGTHLVKTIYLPREIPINSMNEVMNVLRTAFSLRGIYQAEEPRAIVVHDTPQRVALVETIVDHLNTFPTRPKSVQIPAPHYTETGFLGIAAAARPELSLRTFGPVSINLNQDARATYEVLADIAGIKVSFSPDFSPGGTQPFRLEGVDALDALDYFSLVSGNGWKVVDNQTILVFPDTQQNRRDLETQTAKTFYIANVRSASTVNGILNALRTAFSLRNVQSADNTITIQDTPQKMMVVERVIESLDRLPLAPEIPETVNLQIVLSAYQGERQIRTESHTMNVEVGADPARLRSGSEITVAFPTGQVAQHVGIQIDSKVMAAAEGRYKVSITITKRDVLDETQATAITQRVPSIPIFENIVFAGTLILANGGTAQISGTDIIGNKIWRADVTLSVKK